MSGNKYFSKLDLTSAYLQMPLDPASREYVTVNTHKGLFQYNRLPFGVASAPAIFQRQMETLLQGVEGVSVYIDDIISGATLEEHLSRLAEVLSRLENAGLRLNREKCFFLRSSVEYFGYIVDAQGIHPTPEKVAAVKDVPEPTNSTQL